MVIMAHTLNWIPDTLYNYSLTTVVCHYDVFEKDIKLLHCSVLFDVYFNLYKYGQLEKVMNEIKKPEFFARLLKVTEKRNLLHCTFQVLMESGFPIANDLACTFRNYCIEIEDGCELKTIQLGFSIGSFLTEAGWYPESEIIFLACRELCQRNTETVGWSIIFECLKRLLKVRTLYCKFQEAETTVRDALNCIELVERLRLKINFAGVYGEISALYFVQSRSDEAYKWCQKALQSLDSSVPFRELISVYCHASKACLMKKYFKKSGMLIKQALSESQKVLGVHTLLMAEVLMDYGYYLLHIDSTRHSITVYQEVLNILTRILGGNNLRIAAAHEDIAYACYVNEYKSGDFKEAREHIEKAHAIKEKLLEEDHFLLPSAKRMTALIMEEIAIDNQNDLNAQERLFSNAEELHLFAVRVTKQHLGEMNVLTAKQYGNLGRLYQSMKRFQDAEQMHLKAISIKTQILGGSDYEVAISLGHLASLYNYDMLLYRRAETLHLQSIQIGLAQFGKSFSGLEFEYRGLLRIYTHFGDSAKVATLSSRLHDWKILRDQTLEKESKTSPLNLQFTTIQPEKIYNIFLAVCDS